MKFGLTGLCFLYGLTAAMNRMDELILRPLMVWLHMISLIKSISDVAFASSKKTMVSNFSSIPLLNKACSSASTILSLYHCRCYAAVHSQCYKIIDILRYIFLFILAQNTLFNDVTHKGDQSCFTTSRLPHDHYRNV